MDSVEPRQRHLGARSRGRIRRADRARSPVARRAARAKSSASSARPAAAKSVLLRTIIGLIPKRQGTHRDHGHRARRGHARRTMRAHRAALGHAVPAGRAVLLADRAPERAVSDAGEPDICPTVCSTSWRRRSWKWSGLSPDDGDKFPVRAVRRHDQARGAGARAGARSGNRVSRRADLRPRPDLRRAISIR